jgi:hypothetical protein
VATRTAATFEPLMDLLLPRRTDPPWSES